MNNHRQVTKQETDRIWERVRQEIRERGREERARHRAITAWAIVLLAFAVCGIIAIMTMPSAGR